MQNVMKYKDYYATICYEDETSTFYGKIEDINDLVSFEADNVNDLKKEFERAVEDYINICKEAGKEPNKPYKGSFNVRVAPEIHKKAVILSRLKKISLNQFVEEAIKEKINIFENK